MSNSVTYYNSPFITPEITFETDGSIAVQLTPNGNEILEASKTFALEKGESIPLEDRFESWTIAALDTGQLAVRRGSEENPSHVLTYSPDGSYIYIANSQEPEVTQVSANGDFTIEIAGNFGTTTVIQGTGYDMEVKLDNPRYAVSQHFTNKAGEQFITLGLHPFDAAQAERYSYELTPDGAEKRTIHLDNGDTLTIDCPYGEDAGFFDELRNNIFGDVTLTNSSRDELDAPSFAEARRMELDALAKYNDELAAINEKLGSDLKLIPVEDNDPEGSCGLPANVKNALIER